MGSPNLCHAVVLSVCLHSCLHKTSEAILSISSMEHDAPCVTRGTHHETLLLFGLSRGDRHENLRASLPPTPQKDTT